MQNKPNFPGARIRRTPLQETGYENYSRFFACPKQSQFPEPRLLRRWAPRNDRFSREARDSTRPRGERTTNYAKQTQFPRAQISDNGCFQKGLGEEDTDYASVKTKPIFRAAAPLDAVARCVQGLRAWGRTDTMGGMGLGFGREENGIVTIGRTAVRRRQ